MQSFYILSMIFGVFLMFYAINKKNTMKKYSLVINNTSFNEFVNTTNVYDIFEKSDKTLYYLRKIDSNVVLKVFFAFSIFMIFYVLKTSGLLKISQNTLAALGIFIFILVIIAPSYLQQFIIESRIRKIGADIPMFVDLLAVCVQSGMSIENAIKFLEDSIASLNEAFAPFLSKLIIKMNVNGLEAALNDLQNELPSREISMMCSTLKQSVKYGSGIYESLMSLSAEIRESTLLQTEEAIGKLSAKMSVPLILFFMFPVIIVIAAPGVMRVLGGIL